VTVNTNVVGWFGLLLFASGAYLWRSGLSPKNGEPKSRLDRGLRVFGAVLLSADVIYFVGFGLGMYGSNLKTARSQRFLCAVYNNRDDTLAP